MWDAVRVRPSLFQFAGGEPAFRALAAAHHARCLADPELNHPFSHPGQHPRHVERLAAYWAEVLGGPPTYSQSCADQSHVLTLRRVMRQPRPDDDLDGPELGPDVIVRDAVRTVLGASAPVRIGALVICSSTFASRLASTSPRVRMPTSAMPSVPRLRSSTSCAGTSTSKARSLPSAA